MQSETHMDDDAPAAELHLSYRVLGRTLPPVRDALAGLATGGLLHVHSDDP